MSAKRNKIDRPANDGGDWGEIELDPFEPDADSGEVPAYAVRLDRLPDGALVEDRQERLFNIVRQGPMQGSTEIVDDNGTHAYYDCGTLVRLHERA